MHINPDSKISKVIPTRKDKAAPGVLAEQLAAARETAQQKIAAAQADLDATRQNVIQRGAQRMQDIAALQVELAQEQSALDAVVSQAKD